MPSDDQIVRSAMAGDAAAFGLLVNRHQGLVEAICRRLLGQAEDAADASQDTFVRGYLSLGQLQDPGRFRAWLRRVAYSVCVNRLKARHSGLASIMTVQEFDATEFPDVEAGPDQQAQAHELASTVLESIRRLPERYRQPIEMFYLEGASGAEIARRLGLKTEAVRTRLARGRDLLRPALTKHWSVESLSRTKELRRWLPSRLERQETMTMKLQHEETRARLLRGEAEVIIRPMTRDDLPAMRKFDTELTGTIDQINAQFPPGGHSTWPGGPWSDDQWLAEHFEKYQRHGGMALLALEDRGRIVGFADLWPTEEPDPFGRSLDVECIDYFREHFLAGLETVLLAEAEKAARAAGLPALDIGTNTCSGEYVSLRRFGLKVFYEYDHVLCRCRASAKGKAERHVLQTKDADLAGLVKVSHWSPTDFAFRGDDEPAHLVELSWPDRRAIAELWHFNPDGLDNLPVPEHPPNKCELYVGPQALTSPAAMAEALAECAAIAGELGAGEIELPCPSDIDLQSGGLDPKRREFAFAWLRKTL